MTPLTMKKLKLQPLTLATAICLALGAMCLLLISSPPSHAQDSNASKTRVSPKAAITVTTTKPGQSTLPLRLAANGNIAAWQEASVSSESSGLKLQEVLVNVGDIVKRDQVLAVFATDSIQADLALAHANLTDAQVQAVDAAANAERALSLKASGALSTQQIGQYSTADLSAKARVQSAQASLQLQELRLKHAQVLAPDGGVISARSATVGAVLGAGTELFRLIRQGRLEWRAEVTAAELGRIKVGTRVQITSASGSTVQGKVRIVAPTVDAQTRNALVYVDLNETPPNGAVKAGMFARGEFALGSSAAITVPQQAVVVRDGFNFVFTVGKDNKVAQQKVDAGRRVGDQVEILKGLGADVTIAVAGAGFLNDGDTVRVAPTASATPAPAAPAANK
jgi:RND family efflux transporter MFP subunit